MMLLYRLTAVTYSMEYMPVLLISADIYLPLHLGKNVYLAGADCYMPKTKFKKKLEKDVLSTI